MSGAVVLSFWLDPLVFLIMAYDEDDAPGTASLAQRVFVFCLYPSSLVLFYSPTDLVCRVVLCMQSLAYLCNLCSPVAVSSWQLMVRYIVTVGNDRRYMQYLITTIYCCYMQQCQALLVNSWVHKKQRGWMALCWAWHVLVVCCWVLIIRWLTSFMFVFVLTACLGCDVGHWTPCLHLLSTAGASGLRVLMHNKPSCVAVCSSQQLP